MNLLQEQMMEKLETKLKIILFLLNYNSCANSPATLVNLKSCPATKEQIRSSR